MKKIFFIVSLLSLNAFGQQKSDNGFAVKINECVGMNRAAGEYRVSGEISKPNTNACHFDWFLGNENETEAYTFDLSNCGLNIDGYVYFKYTSTGYVAQGKLKTNPDVTFHQNLVCN